MCKNPKQDLIENGWRMLNNKFKKLIVIFKILLV